MTKILVLGDSHGDVFNYCNKNQKDIFFDVIIVPGATAQGAVNPNSKTDALNIFRKKLEEIKADKYDYVIINLGEVDCGHLIWYRRDKLNISIEDQLKVVTTNLFTFATKILALYFSPQKIIINGSVLPTIRDNTDRRFLDGTRSEITTSQHERTQLTLRYNSILKDLAANYGLNYMEITDSILDKETGIIESKFLNKNPYNHHLDNENTYKLWLYQLNKILH